MRALVGRTIGQRLALHVVMGGSLGILFVALLIAAGGLPAELLRRPDGLAPALVLTLAVSALIGCASLATGPAED